MSNLAVIPSRRVPFSIACNYAHSPLMFPVGEREVAWIGKDGETYRIPGQKALVRMTPDGRSAYSLAIVNSGYMLVHNRELFTIVAETMDRVFNQGELDDAYCVDKVAMHGRTCWREYVFPSITRVVGKSHVGLRIIVQNGYGGSALRVFAGAIDFFCTNGMIRGEYETWYKRHTRGLVIGGLRARIEQATSLFTISCNEWEQWAETPVTREQTMAFFREIASTDALYESLTAQWLEEREARGHNMWSIYSALTYYSSHADGNFARRRPDDEKIDGAMMRREQKVARWVRSDAWHRLRADARV